MACCSLPKRKLVRWGLWCGTILVLLIGPLMAARGWAYSHLLEDFKDGLWNAGWSILHHRSVYALGWLDHQVAILRAGGVAANRFDLPVYPAPINVAMTPLALLPFSPAGVIYTALNVAAMFAGLYLMDVRDWRCYAVVCVSWPFLYGICLGEVGQFLVLAAAIVWRYRDRVVAPAFATASIVTAKVFPWTIGVWLLATRRFREFFLGLGIGLALLLAGWAVVGWQGMTTYPRLLSDVSTLEDASGDSIARVIAWAGASRQAAAVVCLLVACGLLAWAWRMRDERRSFSLAVMAALAGTPVVWDHYMVLLFVPIALMRPSFSWEWLAPALIPVGVYCSLDVWPNSNGFRSGICWLLLEAAIVVWVGVGPQRQRFFQQIAARRGWRLNGTPSGFRPGGS